jgi:hypothetical protein
MTTAGILHRLRPKDEPRVVGGSDLEHDLLTMCGAAIPLRLVDIRDPQPSGRLSPPGRGQRGQAVTVHEELKSFAAAVHGETDTYRRPPTETHDDMQELIVAVKTQWLRKTTR